MERLRFLKLKISGQGSYKILRIETILRSHDIREGYNGYCFRISDRTAYYLGNLQAGSQIPDMYPVWLDTGYGIRLFSLSTIQPVPVASFVWQKLHLHKRPSYLASRISGVQYM